MTGPPRTLEPIPGIHDLVALRLPGKQLDKGARLWTALGYNDHLLRRFGQVDVLRLESGANLAREEQATADEIWTLLEGQARFEWQDHRPSSPTTGATAVFIAREPTSVLVPFGVAFRVTTADGSAVLLRLASEADGDHLPPASFRSRPRA